jgi:F-type H+-transporting ATPase subunit epsilon
MHLKILLPTGIFADKTGVLSLVAPTNDGSFGFLEHRLDCVAVLVPGILTYKTEEDGTVFVAVDEGVLVKTGADVHISIRRAIGGKGLGDLQEAIKSQFLIRDKVERSMREAVSKMEAGLFGRLVELERDR